MPAVVIRIVLLISAVFMLTALVIYADSDDVRYFSERRVQRLGNVIFKRHSEATAPDAIDVAFFGASRTRRAVMLQELAPVIEQRLGREVTLRELGAPFAGMGARYIHIRDLLKHRRVKTIFLEYSPTFEQFPRTNPDFFRLATVTDIFTDPLSVDAKALSRVSYRLTLVAMKYASAVGYLGKQLLSGATMSMVNDKTPHDLLTPIWIDPLNLSKTKRVAEEAGTYLNPTVVELDTAEAIRTAHYVDKIIRLTKSHGTELIIWNLPDSNRQQYDAESIESFENRFDMGLLNFPDEVRDELRIGGYADTRHLNRYGARRIQPILVDWIMQLGNLE